MPQGRKLRCHPLDPPLHVVLVEPEIPPNTGTIARTCGATCTPLHLIEPLGFRIDDAAVRRAGLDYWHLVDVTPYPDFETFEEKFQSGRLHFFSSNATASYLEADIVPGDALVFGKESVGLSEDLLANRQRVWAIPTSGHVRSLNLSNSVSIVLYEALRRNHGLDRTYFSE